MNKEQKVETSTDPAIDAKLPVSGCRQGDLCIICGGQIDADYGSVCSNCDDTHLDD
jgi:hypothetical protein